jgi:membrane protein
MKRYFGQLGRSFTATGREMLHHEVPRDAASISYFWLLALFPAILIIITLVDTFLGWLDLHDIVIESIVALYPGSHQFIESTLNEILSPSLSVFFASVIVLLWSSSWIFTFIESSINRAWDISNQRTFWQSRLRAIALVGLAGVSLLSSAAITAFVASARSRTEVHVEASSRVEFFIGWFWSFVLIGAGLLIAVLVFTFVFKWAPHRTVFWKDALSGAVIATIMWQIGSTIFLNLVPYFDYQRVYGRMGAVIALLAWVYTSNLILLFGANFSAQFHWISVNVPDYGPHERK